MSHVINFRIDGLLDRQHPIECELRRDVNVFFGANGCGKTTLLKVLNAALDVDGRAMERLPVKRAEVTIFSIDEDQEIRHTWERSESPSELSRKGSLKRLMVSRNIGSEWVESVSARTEWVQQRKSKPNHERKSRAHRWQHTFLPTTRLYVDQTLHGAGSDAGRVSEAQFDKQFGDSINQHGKAISPKRWWRFERFRSRDCWRS